jgi:hypothetical protein
MARYDKYICTELRKRERLPGPTPAERDKLAAAGKRISMEHVLWIDQDIIPGAYYGESTWIWPASYANQISWAEIMKNQAPMFPHAHDFPELLSWWGTDPDHPEDTTSMGFLMEDEEIPLDRSWIGYIPAGMLHMPTRGGAGKVSRRPVCHWTSGPGAYTREGEGEEEGAHKAPGEEKVPPRISVKKTGKFRNAKYFVYGGEKRGKRPDFLPELDPKYSRPMGVVDEVTVPGAEFGCETFWLLPGEKSKAGQLIMKAHTVPHGTSIVVNAMNYEDITDLRAEAELWIGGEKHIINKSFGAYIPPDVAQGPLIIRNITKQIIFMISYPIGKGIKKYRGGK